MIYRYFFLFLCFCLSCYSIHAQDENAERLSRQIQEAGHPLIQNYTPDDYGAFTQNWGVVQDSLGIMYFANGDGVLIYDGVVWDLIKTPNSSTVFSLDIDSSGTVFVGAQNELGYLAADTIGKLTYKSLLQKLSKKYREFDRISNIYTTSEGVYFCADQFISRWDGTRFKVWTLDCSARMKSYYVNETLYTICNEKGLMRLVNNEFELTSNGEIFALDRVNLMVPYGESQQLVSTQDRLYLYNGENFKLFQTTDPDFFEDNIIYCGVKLQNGAFALGSLYKGILIIDRQGIRQSIISEEAQLLTNQVLGLYQDRSGLLWAALFSGIAKIEYPSPFWYYDQSKEAPKLIYEIMRFEDKLYVGGPDGLFTLEPPTTSSNATLVAVEGVGMVWHMVHLNNSMLVGGIGLHEVSKDGMVSKVNDLMSPIMYRSKLDTNRVFLGLSPGLTSIYHKDGQWIKERNYDEVSFEVAKMKEDPSGNLWLGTYNSELVKMSFGSRASAIKLENPKFRTYDTKDGFPEEIGHPLIIEDQVYFVASTGDLYIYNPLTDGFNLDRSLYEKIGLQGNNIIVNSIDDEGNIWILERENDQVTAQLYAQKIEDGSYKITRIDARRIKNFRSGALVGELKDSTIWYEGKSGIIRHDIRKSSFSPDLTPSVVISKLIYKQDSLIFGGFGTPKNAKIPFVQNQIRFQYASPSFFDEKSNEFQYYLEGYEDSWSSWTKESKKDYTNIPEGDYTFRVRGKNIYGEISEEDSYSFTILPPWYRTWWAYLFYALAGILVVWLFAQLRSQQLRNKNIALEALVDERTEEIRHKNELLSHQTKKLKEMDTMKTRLFANISHEFRTPLTLIKGPIEKLEEAKENKITTTNIKMIRRNANRLLNLVNQLLDLSKLDSGKLRLDTAEGDVFKCIRAAASAFSSHAASRNMDYQIKIPSRLLWASFDRDKLEKISYNLLSNAFKFTADEGSVIITANFWNNQLQLKVSDTGHGIANDKLANIFDRFFQVDDSYTREKAGSGIGLALTRELVELMDGEIYVESELGKGSMFKMMVPLEEIRSNNIREMEDMPVTVFVNDMEEQPIHETGKRKAKVLIIEDNNDMRHFIKEQLVMDYGITEAHNGLEGLKNATRMVPDLIITDLMMPQMDGITLCKKLKTNIGTSHIPVIMLTAKAGIENKLEGLETGADDYLTKPFNAKELQVRVKNLIDQRRQLRQLYAKSISLDPKEITVTSLDEAFLKEVLALMEEKYDDSVFGVPRMQKELGMSKVQLHRKIKALTDHPPGELLRNFRLRRAAQILKQKGENVTQVAYTVGFNNLSYFAKCFKELYGVAPSEYAK